MLSLSDGRGSRSVQKIRLLIADQGNGGIGGGGTGGGSSRLLDPLRLCAGDTEHPNQPDEE